MQETPEQPSTPTENLAPQVPAINQPAPSFHLSGYQLPHELGLLIFSFLDLNDLVLAARVCRCWQQLLQDFSLWQQLFLKYSNGYLWRFLFQKPELVSYAEYFTAVCNEADLNFGNLEQVFNEAKRCFIPGRKIRGRPPETRQVRIAFFEDYDFAQIKVRMQEVITALTQLTPTCRNNLISAPNRQMIYESRRQTFLLLRAIHQLESTLAQLIYVKKHTTLFDFYTTDSFLEENTWSRLLTPKTIIAVATYVGTETLEYLLNTNITAHLEKFKPEDLCKIIFLDYTLVVKKFFKNPRWVNKLTQKEILAIFTKPHVTEETINYIFHFLETHYQELQPFFNQLDGTFLVKLATPIPGERRALTAPVILSSCRLIDRLTDQQCGEILTTIVHPPDTLRVLNSEAFWAYVHQKVKNNISQFLLGIKDMKTVVRHPRSADLLEPNDLMALPRLRFEIDALLEQPIILRKLKSSQLRIIASFYVGTAITLLQSPDANFNRSDLFFLKEEYHGDYEDYPKARELIQKRLQEGEAKCIDHTLKYMPFRASSPVSYPITPSESSDKSKYASPPIIILAPQVIRSSNKPQAQPPARAPRRKASPKTISPTTSKIITGLLIASGILSILLLATGIGALTGIPSMIALASYGIHFLHIGIQAFAFSTTLLGSVGTALSALELLNQEQFFPTEIKTNRAAALKNTTFTQLSQFFPSGLDNSRKETRMPTTEQKYFPSPLKAASPAKGQTYRAHSNSSFLLPTCT